jgi:hypothetical protein
MFVGFSVNTSFSFCLGEYLEVGLINYTSQCILNFIKTAKLFLVWPDHFASLPAMYESFSCLHPHQPWYWSDFSFLSFHFFDCTGV